MIMKTNSLTEKNEFLKKDTSGKSIIRNAATSTSVETGQGSNKYVTRCSNIRNFVVEKNPKSRRK